MVEHAITVVVSAILATIVGFYLNGRFKAFTHRFDNIDKKLEEIDKDLEGHKLHVAERYVTKEEHEKDLNSLKEFMREGFKGIKESIAGLHKRFDRFEDFVKRELDGKEDKRR